MRILALIFALFVGGCKSACPVDVGDNVKSLSHGKRGVVVGIGTGGATKNCTVAVIHDDGTLSRSQNRTGDGFYDSAAEYVYSWKYVKAEN